MYRSLTSVIFSLFLILPAEGEKVVIKGVAPGNNSIPFEVYRLSDPITRQLITLRMVTPDSSGNFSFDLDIEDIEVVWIRNGTVDNYFFAGETQEISVLLSSYEPFGADERENPFFEYRKVHALTLSDNDINSKISRYDSLYQTVVNIISEDLYYRRNKVDYNSMVEALSIPDENNYHPYFRNYTRYKTHLISLIPNRSHESRLLNSGEFTSEFMLNNPSFVEFVHQVFNHYLRDLASGRDGDRVKEIINIKPSALNLKEILTAENIITNERLIEYVILYNLYQEYYDSFFNKKGVVELIDWFSGNATFPVTREIAGIMIKKLKKFMPGSRPPALNLADENGVSVDFERFNDKYLVITFGSSDSWQTISEYNVIKSWYSDLSEDVEVVTILTDHDFPSALERLRKMDFNWVMADGSNCIYLLRDYEVKFQPAFYLLNREGEVIAAPSLFPSENLRKLLLDNIRNDLINDIRN